MFGKPTSYNHGKSTTSPQLLRQAAESLKRHEDSHHVTFFAMIGRVIKGRINIFISFLFNDCKMEQDEESTYVIATVITLDVCFIICELTETLSTRLYLS
jgi:hypothetical protein